LESVANKVWPSVAGESLALTKVSGQGKVLLHSQGALERVDLDDQALTLEGDFVVAHTAGLELKIERSIQSVGDGLVRSFRGTGAVLIAPVPNRFAALVRALRR
jgi:uncharacterized protein (AIM24 family)